MTRAKALDAALGALSRGEPVTGLDERLAAAVTAARPSDARAALVPLLDVDHTTKLHETQVRSALIWPVVTLGTVIFAALVVSRFALPAFAFLPGAPSPSRVAMLVPIVVAILMLALLLVASRRRWSLGLLDVWASLEAHLFASATVAFVKSGVALPAAVRAASEVCSARRRAAALQLARELEAGAPGVETGARLLGQLTARLFASTTSAGTGVTTLEAFVSLLSARLPREVRRDTARLHALGLVVAALALLATGIVFFSSYLGSIGS